MAEANIPATMAAAVGDRGRLHLAHVDGMRAIAALYVVWCHITSRAWGAHRPSSLVLRWVAKLSTHGHFAVTVFIVISGFCLMLPVIRSGNQLRGGSKRFFTRRFWRIAPPMYAAFLLSIAVLQFGRVHLTYGYHQVTLRQVLAHAFLLEVPVPGGLLQNNGVLWSISVESVMYLFFPAIVILTRRIGSISTALACMVVGYGLLFVLRGTIPGGLAWQYLGAFAFGTLAAVVCYSETDSSKSLRDRLPWYSIAVVCVAFVAAIGIGIGWAKADRYTEYFDLPIAIAATAVLIGAARQGRNRIRDALRMRGLVLIGLFSYSLYLIHFPLADLLSVYLVIPLRLGDVGSELMYFGIVVPIIIAAAYFFYLGFEKPFHLLARKMGS